MSWFKKQFGRLKKKKTVDIVVEESFKDWVKEESKRTGKSPLQVVEEAFKEFMVFSIEETTGQATLEYVNLWGEEDKKKDLIAEYRRLRRENPLISACIDYAKDFILGTGIDVKIDDPQDKFQKEIKELVKDFIENVYQDSLTRGLMAILDIMVDEALTTGFAAAEIVYENKSSFASYFGSQKTVEVEGKTVSIYSVAEPDWQKDNLGKIVRLKIINNAIQRLFPVRDPQSWEILYWVLLDKPAESQTGMEIYDFMEYKPNKKSKKPKPIAVFHPAQIFAISINRKDWDYKGTSVIASVYKLTTILEKIWKAVGEGIYRAGNKKYFIICGTEKRPWGKPFIRNTLKLIREMGEKGWTAVPVPAGFDIKEIGGEVFEGTEVIEHFVSMIASAMQTPKDVLQFLRGRVSEGPWRVAKEVHARRRMELAHAIRSQLFARLVWTQYGKEKQKQGGKATEPVYVPYVKWISTPDIRERIEILARLLNVANPVRPELKLEIERELAQLLGYDNIILPTAEEYKLKLEQLEQEMMERGRKKKKAPPTEKHQGEPEKPSEEKVRKRLEKGVSKRIRKSEEEVGEKAEGKARPMGSTRVPKEVKKEIQETFRAEARQALEEMKPEIRALGEALAYVIKEIKNEIVKVKQSFTQRTEKLEEKIKNVEEKSEEVKKKTNKTLNELKKMVEDTIKGD